MAPLLEASRLGGALAKEERVAEEITILPDDVPAFRLCKNCETRNVRLFLKNFYDIDDEF